MFRSDIAVSSVQTPIPGGNIDAMVGAALVLLLVQPPASACSAADEPEFAFAQDKPVRVGGGAMYAASRERRYLDALRGPAGETVQYRRTGSIGVRADRITFLDRYEITYPGLDKPLFLYLDAYHFDDALKAPKGFICAVPFGLNPPGPDAMLALDTMIAFALEQGPKKAFAPISLDADGSATHGVVFDRFRLMARKARAAAASGKPLDPAAPPRELMEPGTIVVAHPLRCGDKDPVPPANIQIVPSQGPPPPRIGELATGEALARLLPGADFPPGSMAAAYGLDHPRPIDAIKVSYAAGACGEARDVVLPQTFTNARPLQTPMPALPAGQPATDLPIRLQALLDLDGAAQQLVYVGGPPALTDAAIAAVRTWTAEPMRLNGAPMVTPVTFQVKFGSR
jgi:hypothetical protein